MFNCLNRILYFGSNQRIILHRLCQHFIDDMPVHIGEPPLEAVVEDAEVFVVKAEEVEHGGVEVVERVDVLNGLGSEVVGGAMGYAGFDAGTGQYSAETIRVVIAAFGAFLEHRHAAKFSAPEDQGILQQAALLEVPDQSC